MSDKTGWQIADEISRTAASIGQGQPDARVADMVSRLAVVVRDCAERVGLRLQAGEVEPLQVGHDYEITLRVRARVTDRMGGPDDPPSYELQLEQRSYYDGRMVSVDHDEISLADPIE